jgi:hypothetical protein
MHKGPGNVRILWHNLDMRFGTWTVRRLYRADSLQTVAREVGKYKLDLVGVQEVRWEKEGTGRAEDYTRFYGKGIEDHQLGTVQSCLLGYHP